MINKLRARARNWFFSSLATWLFPPGQSSAPTIVPPAPPTKPPFNLRRELSWLIETNSRTIDTYFPDANDPERVVNTHVGSLNRHAADRIAKLLIAASENHAVDVVVLTALTYVNARWSPEAYDHRLRAGESGISFNTTRWGMGLFSGTELRQRDDMRFHSEGYVCAKACDPDWAIDEIARELADHLEWGEEHRDAYAFEMLDRLVGGPVAHKGTFMAALAFYLRDRHAALDIIWAKTSDPAAVDYARAVLATVERFAPMLEPAP